MSYTSQQFIAQDNSTDAAFRVWGSAISAALAAMGWVQQADTGQVNWTTVTVPSDAYVFEIWSPGDALTQFYLKLEYGYSATYPNMRVSIGTGTNGAGTLTVYVSSLLSLLLTYAGGNNSTPFECNFSGDTNRCGALMFRNHSSANFSSFMFAVERTKNVDGTDNSIGVTLIGVGCNSQKQQTIVFGVGVGNPTTNTYFCALSNGANASGQFQNNIPFSPMFPDHGLYGNPQTVMGFVHTQDVAEGCFFTATLYGATRIYIASALNALPTWPAYSKFCMRFD